MSDSKFIEQFPINNDDEEKEEEMPRWRFVLIMIASLFLPFLYSLDMLMLATSMPVIVDAFNALDKVAWLSNCFFATMFGFNLLFAQWLQLVPAKHIALFAVFVYELGCTVAGSARSIDILLVGRALSGIGAAGLYNVAVMLITELCDITLRATMLSMLGLSFACASILGPVMGGELTVRYSWRWCFYVNIPMGVVCFVMIAVFVRTRPPWGYETVYTGYDKTLLKRFAKCDWCGFAFCMTWVVVLIVALFDGGQRVKWSDPTEIVLLVLLAALPVAFYFWERYMDERALFQVCLMHSRTIRACSVVGMCVFANSIVVLYFISEMYRAVYRLNSVQVSIYLFAYVLTNPIALMASAYLLVKTRFGLPILLAGALAAFVPTVVMAVYAADRAPIYVPCVLSVFVSMGIGFVSQATLNMAQIEYRDCPRLLASASGITIFFNNMGRVVGPAVASCVFANRLHVNMQRFAPSLDAQTRKAVLHRSEAIWTIVPKETQPDVLHAYSLSLSQVFFAASGFGALAVVGALMAKWRRFA